MSLRLDQFHFYDREAGTKRTRHDLPHWEQRSVCAFVTMRLADSLPRAEMERWRTQRDAWLLARGITPDEEDRWREALENLPDDERDEFHRTFTRLMHAMLDAGHGECWLRRADLRQIVADSFGHWNEQRCLLAGWVIMPNHAHLLVQPMPGESLLKICRSWKQWTGRAINEAVGRTGEFWQYESWDHLLRRVEYLRKFREYMRLNPVKARLREKEYAVWLPDIEGLT